MAFDTYLKFFGARDTDTSLNFKDWIEVLSWSWGASNSENAAGGGGGGTGKVSVHDLSFTKRVDKTTPWLLTQCCTGEHIKKATLHVRKAGGEQQEYYTITMEDVLVSGFQTGGSSQDAPMDRVALNFQSTQVQVGSAKGGIVQGGCTAPPPGTP